MESISKLIQKELRKLSKLKIKERLKGKWLKFREIYRK
jgi:hypothetical protein